VPKSSARIKGGDIERASKMAARPGRSFRAPVFCDKTPARRAKIFCAHQLARRWQSAGAEEYK